jgi:sugar/nucleoside kinase (ribokinase family)
MAITVVGSVAYDTIETPAGKRERCLGGAATYFSLAASYFTDVRVIAVVGEDFGRRQEAVFQARNIDTRGIEHMAGKSFFWEGSYLENLNEAKTHITDLNVFAAFEPKIPDFYHDSEFLFLANIDPVLQRRVREAMPDVKLVAGDTMNYWIKDHRAALLEVLKGLDILLINDTEDANAGRQQQPGAGGARGDGAGAEAAGGEARRIWGYAVSVKHAKTFRAPAMLLEEVIDPTGAGDSFAGGFFGYLASQPEQSPAAYRRAMFYGSVMGSFACERFGTERLQQLTREEIDERFNLVPRVDAP